MKSLRMVGLATLMLLAGARRVAADGVDGCTLNCEASHTACLRNAGAGLDGAAAKTRDECEDRHAQCLQRCAGMTPSDRALAPSR